METLSPGQCAALARRAAEECLSRLELIAENVSPADRALRRLLGELIAKARARREAARNLPVPLSEPLGAPEQAFLRTHIPSLGSTFGEGYLSRDAAFYFAERLKEEASRFYRALAEAAPEEPLRHLLEHAALEEWGHLERLRTVLL